MLRKLLQNLLKYWQKHSCIVNTVSSLSAAAICIYLSFVSPAIADPFETVKARLSMPTRTVRYAPVSLGGSGQLTIESPAEWYPLSREMLKLVKDVNAEHVTNLGDDFKVNVELRLMEEEDFFHETGAPRWTNAMYYRGQVMIPLAAGEPIDYDNIYRAVRHEYTHAVINAASGGTCPGWLDEGYASYFEGRINPDLTRAYLKWLSGHNTLPFDILQGGFTKLENSMVPAAYAQSLYAAKNIIDYKGHRAIGDYLRALREHHSRDSAFQEAFGEDELTFESRFSNFIRRFLKTSGVLEAEHKHELKEAINQSFEADLQSLHGMVSFQGRL